MYMTCACDHFLPTLYNVGTVHQRARQERIPAAQCLLYELLEVLLGLLVGVANAQRLQQWNDIALGPQLRDTTRQHQRK